MILAEESLEPVTGLLPGQLAGYRRDGFVFPVAALDPCEVVYFRDAFAATRQAIGPEARTVDIRHPQLFFLWAYELATRPRILDAVASIVGDDILLTRGGVFFKDPVSDVAHPLHQDAYSLGFSEADADLFVTAWIALTPSGADNGGVRFYPGTQHLRFNYSSTQSDWASRNAEIVDPLDPAQEVPAELKAGSMSLHHAGVVHRSEPNRSFMPRVGVVMRYAATRVRQRVPIRQPALLVRGHDRYGLYPLAVPPRNNIASGLVKMREFMAFTRLRAAAGTELEMPTDWNAN